MTENSNQLRNLRVAILATDGFEEAELLEPRKALDEAGAKTTLIAPKSGQLRAMKHDEKAGSVKVDMTLDDADPANFDAVLLPGGALNADALRVNQRAQAFVKQIDAQRNPIAVICHGPWLLISAGLTPNVRLRVTTRFRTTSAIPGRSGSTRRLTGTRTGSAAGNRTIFRHLIAPH
jgi:protease I